jgi:hypothetical protein
VDRRRLEDVGLRVALDVERAHLHDRARRHDSLSGSLEHVGGEGLRGVHHATSLQDSRRAVMCSPRSTFCTSTVTPTSAGSGEAVTVTKVALLTPVTENGTD